MVGDGIGNPGCPIAKIPCIGNYTGCETAAVNIISIFTRVCITDNTKGSIGKTESKDFGKGTSVFRYSEGNGGVTPYRYS